MILYRFPSVGLFLARHGNPRSGARNFWTGILMVAIILTGLFALGATIGAFGTLALQPISFIVMVLSCGFVVVLVDVMKICDAFRNGDVVVQGPNLLYSEGVTDAWYFTNDNPS